MILFVFLFLLQINLASLGDPKYDFRSHVIHHVLFLLFQGKMMHFFKVRRKLLLHYFLLKYLIIEELFFYLDRHQKSKLCISFNLF